MPCVCMHAHMCIDCMTTICIQCHVIVKKCVRGSLETVFLVDRNSY